YFASVAGYRDILAGPDEPGAGRPPKIEEIDALITSVAGIDPAPGGPDPWRHDIFTVLEVPPERQGTLWEDLRAASVGDVAGLYRPRGPGGHPLVDRINRCWTGIHREHIADCARKAREDRASAGRGRGGRRPRPPGVIVLAHGAAKADVIRRCV